MQHQKTLLTCYCSPRKRGKKRMNKPGKKKKNFLKKCPNFANPLAVQQLGLHASTSGDTCSVPDLGIKILAAARHSQKGRKGQIFLKLGARYNIAVSRSSIKPKQNRDTVTSKVNSHRHFTLAHKYICTMILFTTQFIIARMELMQMSIKMRLGKQILDF